MKEYQDKKLFINLNKKLIPHFLRGWIDGDGYIRTKKYQERLKLVGNSEAIEWFSKTLLGLGFNKQPLIYNYNNKCWSELIISGRKNIQNLYKILKADTELRLDRKWELIEQL